MVCGIVLDVIAPQDFAGEFLYVLQFLFCMCRQCSAAYNISGETPKSSRFAAYLFLNQLELTKKRILDLIPDSTYAQFGGWVAEFLISCNYYLLFVNRSLVKKAKPMNLLRKIKTAQILSNWVC